VSLVYIKNLSRQFVVIITILIPFVFTGAIFAGAPSNDLNADLIKASFSGDMPEVERLLANGADVNGVCHDYLEMHELEVDQMIAPDYQ
jgi:hypothetical protein